MNQHRTRGRALGRGLMWLAMLALVAAAAWGWHDFNRFSHTPLHVTRTGDSIDIARGSSFKTIVADVQALVEKGDIAGAKARITDYETAWDQAETAIRPLDQTQWGNIDQANDAAFGAIRKSSPDPAAVKGAIATLVATLNDPTKAP